MALHSRHMIHWGVQVLHYFGLQWINGHTYKLELPRYSHLAPSFLIACLKPVTQGSLAEVILPYAPVAPLAILPIAHTWTPKTWKHCTHCITSLSFLQSLQSICSEFHICSCKALFNVLFLIWFLMLVLFFVLFFQIFWLSIWIWLPALNKAVLPKLFFRHCDVWCEHYLNILTCICRILCVELLPHDWLIIPWTSRCSWWVYVCIRKPV